MKRSYGLAVALLLHTAAAAAADFYREDYFLSPMTAESIEPVRAWGPDAIRLDRTLRRELASDLRRAGVIVAVIDTGLDYDHADLAIDNLWQNDREQANGIDDDGNGYVDDFLGWDFIDDDNDPWDWVGHGTHVAGIIAASAGNGIGIAGVDSHARIMALRALNSAGHGLSTRVAEAIRYAADNGARVINLSMAVKDVSPDETAAIRYAIGKDVVVVAAAGNAGDDVGAYTPAAVEGVLTVGAIDEAGNRAKYSNWGGAVDVVAPGSEIVSLRAANTDFMLGVAADAQPLTYAAGPLSDYYRATGTSFAAPFVAGAASLLRSRNPSLTEIEVRRMIVQSANDIDVPGIDQFTGYGRLDVPAMLAAVPAFFIEAAITGVEVVAEGGIPKVRVLGAAAADQRAAAWIEIGQGDAPQTWKRVTEDIKPDVGSGRLADVDATPFAGAKQWTLRLVVEHANGQRREARFLINLG